MAGRPANPARLSAAFLLTCLISPVFGGNFNSGANGAVSWSPAAAARRLDSRENWWSAWPPARRDRGTVCLSCHTSTPYALARPRLRAGLGENGPAEGERRLLESVATRVRRWGEIQPYYSGVSRGEDKAAQSRGTESVLNALVLANAANGQPSGDVRAAFDNMWALQRTSGEQRGAWNWLDFGNEPFEARESVFYGASLAALAVGMAPENERAGPAMPSRLERLRNYIRRELPRQPLIQQAVALWAAAKWPGLLTPAERAPVVAGLFDTQRADGGWSLASLSWTWGGSSLRSIFNLWARSDYAPLAGRSAGQSDGYATGLIVLALEEAGVPRDDAHLRRGRAWLMERQDRRTGAWPGYSLNSREDPSSGTGQFMTDAATAYAVLALTADAGR